MILPQKTIIAPFMAYTPYQLVITLDPLDQAARSPLQVITRASMSPALSLVSDRASHRPGTALARPARPGRALSPIARPGHQGDQAGTRASMSDTLDQALSLSPYLVTRDQALSPAIVLPGHQLVITRASHAQKYQVRIIQCNIRSTRPRALSTW